MFAELLLSRKNPCTTQSTTTAKWQAEAYCAHPHIPMPCRASLGWSSKGCVSDSACSSTTQLSGQERAQGSLGGTIASLDGSQNISTSEVGLVSPHGSSCCHSLQKGILPFSHFFSSKVFSGPCGSTSALQSLIYEYFLHQQQGVVTGMVADFLAILIAITNSSEAFKKRNITIL